MLSGWSKATGGSQSISTDHLDSPRSQVYCPPQELGNALVSDNFVVCSVSFYSFHSPSSPTPTSLAPSPSTANPTARTNPSTPPSAAAAKAPSAPPKTGKSAPRANSATSSSGSLIPSPHTPSCFYRNLHPKSKSNKSAAAMFLTSSPCRPEFPSRSLMAIPLSTTSMPRSATVPASLPAMMFSM